MQLIALSITNSSSSVLAVMRSVRKKDGLTGLKDRRTSESLLNTGQDALLESFITYESSNTNDVLKECAAELPFAVFIYESDKVRKEGRLCLEPPKEDT